MALRALAMVIVVLIVVFWIPDKPALQCDIALIIVEVMTTVGGALLAKFGAVIPAYA